jgi:hypothetical protein
MADVREKLYAQFYVQVRKATSENYEKLRTAFRAEAFSCSKKKKTVYFLSRLPNFYER